MRKNVIRCFALLLTVLLIGSVGMAAKKVTKPQKIRWFADTIITKNQGHQQFCEEFKKQTGIELEIIMPIHNQYYDKLRLAFASNDIPDVAEVGGLQYALYANEGAFVDLGKYVSASPTLKKVNKGIFNACKVRGKLYAIPKQQPDGVVTYIRQDWLNNLKLKVPTTWDEYYKVMKAFTENDPDKNGKKDTYAVTSSGPSGDSPISLADNYYRDFYRESTPDYFLKGGKWADGMAQPNFKNGLERLRKAYQEKLLDQEIFTNKTSTCRDKFTSGKCGIFTYWAGIWMQRMEILTQNTDTKSAKLTVMKPMRGSYYAQRVPVGVAITSKAKNPEGLFKYFIEYMHDGGRGQMLFSLGVENVHWEMKNGERVFLPLLDNPKEPFTKLFIPQDSVLVPWAKAPIATDERITVSNNVLRKYGKIAPMQPYPDSRQKLDEQISAARNEVLSKVLMGQKTSTEALAEYRKKVQAIGINKVLADMDAQMK